ncbi:MAG: AAA family ATPase [Acetanaerobacterium sp.]
MGDFIVAIAREYGSGGRLIGQQLARELNVSFFDKELISLAAKESGFAEDFIQKMEQKKSLSFLGNLYMTSQELPASEQVFLAQSKAIHKIAEKQSCVIVGRCADYVLREHEKCIRIFIHAPLEQRMKRIREEYHEDRPNLQEYVKKQDKNRASYYNYFTQNKWGKAQNYHLSVDSSMGVSVVVNIIKELVIALSGGDA